MVNPVPVLLKGGPHDGHTDAAFPGELGELVTVAWCRRCCRQHVHPVAPSAPTMAAVYLRDFHTPVGGGVLLYRHLSVDDAVDELLHEQAHEDHGDRLFA